MRRIGMIGTVLAVLVGAASAYAAFNSYTATYSFSRNSAGSTKAPVPVSFNETLTAAGTGGNRAAPLIDLKSKIYGMVTDGKDFPTCSLTKIASLKNDTSCPSGALVATASVIALIGQSNQPTAPGTACQPLEHIWNAGQGKIVLFFVETPAHQCGGLQTGSTAPFPGTIRVQGKYLVTDIPLPPDISTKAANITGLDSSLTRSTFAWHKMTKKVHGKTVGYVASTGCQKGKRPYSVAFTAQLNGVNATQTEAHTASCHS